MASPDTLSFIFKLVLETPPAAEKAPDDNGIYKVMISGGNGHIFTNSVKKPAADKLKFYPDKVAAPAAADCFLQLWELDDWSSEGTTKRFDTWYQIEDEDVANGVGGNKLIGWLGGVVAQSDKKAWEFQVLDDSGLKEAAKDQPFMTLKYKKGGSEVTKKVAIDVVNESRWDLGLFPTTKKDGKQWEKTQYPYPPFFLYSLRNLIRMQLAEGGLTVGGFSRLNQEAEESIKVRYKLCLKQLQTQVANGKGKVAGQVDLILARAAELRKKAAKPVIDAAVVAKTKSELTRPLETKIAGMKGSLAYIAGHGAENWATWSARLTKLFDDAQTAAKKTCWDKVKTVYELVDTQAGLFTGATAISIYPDLGFDKAEEADPDKDETPSTKSIYDIFNDSEFPNNSGELAKEFGFLTLDKSGELTKGVGSFDTLGDVVPYMQSIADAVEKKYPELVNGKKPKIFRFIIFTHGDTKAGLKFPDDWFRVKNFPDARGVKFVDDMKSIMATPCVLTLFACSTGGNPKVKDLQKAAIDKMTKANVAKRDAEKTALTEKDPKKLKPLKKAIDDKYAVLLAAEVKKKNAEWKAMSSNALRLLSYGGDPASKADLKNEMGEGSFAKTLRDKLGEKGIKADIWSHTDPGHTSRNARIRAFSGDGKSHDLVRLVFQETAEFKVNNEPTKEQMSWWWERGGDTQPMSHQHSIKKAALCQLATLTETKGPLNLKKIIEDFRTWNKG